MNFYVKRRARPVLQIISMIDILIVLLIFLVVTTTFKEAQNVMKVALPKTETLATGADQTERIGLVVTKDEKIFIGDNPVDAERIAEGLEEARARNPEAKLELRIDASVPFGMVVKVRDALVKSGFKDVPARVLKGK